MCIWCVYVCVYILIYELTRIYGHGFLYALMACIVMIGITDEKTLLLQNQKQIIAINCRSHYNMVCNGILVRIFGECNMDSLRK